MASGCESRVGSFWLKLPLLESIVFVCLIFVLHGVGVGFRVEQSCLLAELGALFACLGLRSSMVLGSFCFGVNVPCRYEATCWSRNI